MVKILILGCLALGNSGPLVQSGDGCTGPKIGWVEMQLRGGKNIRAYAFFSLGPDRYPKTGRFIPENEDKSTCTEITLLKKLRIIKDPDSKGEVQCDRGPTVLGEGSKLAALPEDSFTVKRDDILWIEKVSAPLDGLYSDTINGLSKEDYLSVKDGLRVKLKMETECGGVGCDYELWSARTDLDVIGLRMINRTSGADRPRWTGSARTIRSGGQVTATCVVSRPLALRPWLMASATTNFSGWVCSTPPSMLDNVRRSLTSQVSLWD